LAVSPEEEITTIVALQEFSEETFIFMGTSKGVVKKVKTSDFSNAKTRGIIAINLDNGDKLISALLTTGHDEVVLISRKGIALRYNEESVRTMGRSSHGVRGISLMKGDELAGLMKVNANEAMLLISEFGYGKRVNYDNFTPHGRGTRGQTAYKITEDTGEVVKALSVSEKDEIVCISSKGNTLKLVGSAISLLGKTARGVKVVSIDKPDFVVGAARVIAEDTADVGIIEENEELPISTESAVDNTGPEEENEDI
jgi:DNA gyrase subunit A